MLTTGLNKTNDFIDFCIEEKKLFKFFVYYKYIEIDAILFYFTHMTRLVFSKF